MMHHLGKLLIVGLAALGLLGGRVALAESDLRDEYRLIFERSFEAWINAVGRAEHCRAEAPDNDEIASVVAAAAAAFYPGIWNYGIRGEYEDQLLDRVPRAREAGASAARSGGCLMEASRLRAARSPVDAGIRAALSIDN